MKKKAKKITRGDWWWSSADMCIVNKKNGYYWSFENVKDSAGVLDFIVQISKKTWLTSASVGDAVRLLNHVFNIQGTWCGGGNNHVMPAAQAMKETSQLRAFVEENTKAGVFTIFKYDGAN